MESINLSFALPEYVVRVCDRLETAGRQAYIVGGAVRDLLLGRRAKDFDVATDAHPDLVESLFHKVVPTGKAFGTMTVIMNGHEVQVTTFRSESSYTDSRRPDIVQYSDSLEEDLSRRDFTINALAYQPKSGLLYDCCNGLEDIRRRIIRTVGDPDERFQEDALRLLRAVRFASVLGRGGRRFTMDGETYDALFRNHQLLSRISPERIRDEVNGILLGGRAPLTAFYDLWRTGLLKYIMPDLVVGIGVCQPHHRHATDVFHHGLKTATLIEPRLEMRLAALLHDAGKPYARTEFKGEVHFYGHELFGAEIAMRALRHLRYPNSVTAAAVHLIRHHMEIAHLPEDSPSALRRLVGKVGRAHIGDLLLLHRADLAAGAGPAEARRRTAALERQLLEMRKEASVLTIGDLAIDGHDVMEALGIPPGPEVGLILQRCYDMVMDDPGLNSREKLLRLVRGQEYPGREGDGGSPDRNRPKRGREDHA